MPSLPNRPDVVVGVAVPVPGLGLLSYRVPDGRRPPKGARVAVPLGPRVVTGCVVEPDAAAVDGATLRDVVEILDDGPFLPETIVDLALWVAEYYACGPGDTLLMAMPPAARRGEQTSFRTVTMASLVTPSTTTEGPRGVRQREAMAELRRVGRPMSLAEFAAVGISAESVRALERQGLVRFEDVVAERDPFASGDDGKALWALASVESTDRQLSEEQRVVMDRLGALADARAFAVSLLHGVTGSGKTEVYLQLARHVLAHGRRVLVLVPEIALTPAVAGLFRARFGARVAIQHSGLSDGERHDQWHRIRRGDVDIVVGTRSAVFAPVANLGLVIVDEEHESSYKQDEAPRYHGRDVAIKRAQMEGALVLLGSATPSLESATHARAGRYTPLALTRRILDRPLAAVQIVDMRREFAAHGPDVRIGSALAEAIRMRLTRGEQSLVLLNRRGFATVIFCRQCGASLECPHCSVTLTWHRAARRVRCHYCNYAAAIPRTCGECGGEYLEQSGFGTERLEADLHEQFSGARIARIDRDTIRRRGAIARVLAAVAAGEVDILVGTQMIAKGHDFPAVTLVGVIAADVGLGLADFRASERTFQLLTQVVGRAGRGHVAGEAIVQTLYPDHYSVVAAAAQDYETFYAREIEFRRAMQYPPAVSLINVVTRGKTMEAALDGAQMLVANLRKSQAPVRIMGPAPAALSKIQDEYRAQFFLKGTQRRPMREALLAALEQHPEVKRRTLVDVDPVSVM